ncbi:MAG TPA: exodeoxyribonuclease VII large subunit [Rhodocyclaceae bacterium]|nr:exodeoxyribonuclease VII large subunit [Rhodocyclaceae bacterium]
MHSAASTDAPVGTSAIPVSELVRRARLVLESSTALAWVVGEVSNLTHAASGHIYFTLKDDVAQMRCVMWRNRAQFLPFQLIEGTRIEVRAQLTVYEPRGEMQLSVETIRHSGLGNLYEAYLRLKAKLEAEGLFDSAAHRPLPRLPQTIGIVTSLAAAALRDVLATLKRRAPSLCVVIYPTPVQGHAAGIQIADAIALANARSHADGIEALIVCRGGGSIEDLWAFNEEAVVRAIRACKVPVVSGVGHETDTTLSDFAADLRAATPTAAAEAISAGLVDLRARLPQIERNLQRATRQHLNSASQRLDIAQRHLVHPRERFARGRSTLENLALRLRHARQQSLNAQHKQLSALSARLVQHKPHIQSLLSRLPSLRARLQACVHHRLETAQARLDALSNHLAHLNPDEVLQRGYAIVRNVDGTIIRSVLTLREGDALNVRLTDGTAHAQVLKTNKIKLNATKL